MPAPVQLSSASAGAERPRLLLLDGHSLAYRAFYALPVENFSTTTGQATNAVYGFTAMLINVLRDEAPSHLAVAFDVSRTTFRTEQYADYKANRTKAPDEFHGQVALVKEVLGALRIPVLEAPGYEADDVIATMAGRAAADGFEVLVSTGDRDAFQLVDETTTVLYVIRGVSELTRMTPAAVQGRYGVPPERYADLAALVGETSDNLPGVPGVGPKTAAKWLTEYGSLSDLVDRVDEVKGKAGENLRAHLAQVLTNRSVNTLIRDLDLDLRPDDLVLQPWDREAVHRVFDTLQFRVLRERLYATLAPPVPEAEGGIEVSVGTLAPGEVEGWLAAHVRGAADAARGRTGVAVRGTWGRGSGDAIGVGLASGDGAGAWLDLAALTPADERALGDWLGDAQAPKVMHDAKGQLHALHARGLPLAGLASDTELSAFLALPGQRAYDLADLVLRFLGRELRADDGEPGGAARETADAAPAEAQLTLDVDPVSDEALRAQDVVRAGAVVDLADALDVELDKGGGRRLLDEVELPLVGVLAEMERAGVAVDEEHLAALEASFAGAVKSAADDAYAALGHEVNLGSPKQLQTVLFDELGMPKTKRTKTGYTTDADALAELHAKTDHPFLAALLRHRDATRLRTTVEGLLKCIDPDGRIRTTYNQTVAATGRLSSVDPNLQNIPIRTEDGRRIREAFMVGPGQECLLTADYSQIEMRIMAHLSDDAGLLEAFGSGHDFHAATASRVFGVPPEQITGAMRAKIKAMNYGLAYGLSAFGLSRQLGVDTAEAQRLMDEYFEEFGGVRDYLRSVVAEARQEGYTETILGRRRYLPDLVSDNRQRREMAERMALNAPIQGSAADIIKVAMLGVHSGLREQGLASRLLLQVHDELVLEVAPGERAAVEELVRTRMGDAYPMRAPLEVSVGAGRSWQDAAH